MARGCVKVTMPESWKPLIADVIATTAAKAEESLSATDPEGTPDGRAYRLGRAIMEGLGPDDWAGPQGYWSQIERSVYSPVQLLLYRCAANVGSGVEEDYPFLFGTIGLFLQRLVTESPKESDALPPPFPGGRDTSEFWKTVQAVFRVREMREEGEQLSVEAWLPHPPASGESIALKKLAQIYGRGVGIVSAAHFSVEGGTKGEVQELFRNHDTTPSALLYTLRPTYSKVPTQGVSLALRRDRSVIVATSGNPVLEFYDGGWHVTDLNSGKGLLLACLTEHFGATRIHEALGEALIRLAYHMASHWHSGILAVVDCDVVDRAKSKILERQKDWSASATKIIRDELKRVDKLDEFNVKDIEKTGLGRALLTNAIQDGATLFDPDGKFHSAGRIVSQLPDQIDDDTHPPLGSGNRAAQKLSEYGVAMKVSEDGAIRLYSKPPDKLQRTLDAFRIR